MSGYGGVDDHNKNIDAVVDNAIDVARANLPDTSKASSYYCMDDDCDEEIPSGRRAALPGVQYCVHCAPKHVTKINIRAVDWIL